LKRLRGRWPVAGVFWEAALVAEEEVRRRSIALWSRGSRMLAFDLGWLLIFPAPRSLRVERLAGDALLETQTRLASGYLPAAEVASFPPSSLLLRRGDGWEYRRLDQGTFEDPSAWLDLGQALRLEGRGLGQPPAAPTLAPAPAGDPRRALGIGEASPEAAEVARRLAGQKPFPGRVRLLFRFVEWLAARFAWRKAPAARTKKLASAAKGKKGGAARAADDPQQESWLARLALSLGVWRWAGYQHLRYLRGLLQALDERDFEVALRKAIPLSGSQEKGGVPSLSAPVERWELKVTSGAGGGGSSFGPDFFKELKERYRRMAEELERRGEIEKAAFVWAELLDQAEHAVGLLEKHQLFRQAAEIAEIRSLPPALAVRLHFLAGNYERALDLAAAYDVFALAVQLLERGGRKDKADNLRRVWAARLATAGDHLGAVDALWPLPEKGALLPLIERGLASAGGRLRAQLLSRLLQVAPARAAEVLADWRTLLEAGEPQHFERRRAMAELLLADQSELPVAPLARATLRSMIPDGGGSELRKLYVRLAAKAADPVLAEETRLLVIPPRVEATPQLPLRHRSVLPGGGLAIRDMLVLSGNRLLVAAGENGVFLLGPDGRVEHCFPEPADQLIGAARGHRVIAVARRPERRFRLSRLDLRQRTSELWMEEKLEAVAPEFDGQRLAIGRDGALEILDATAAGCRIVWRMPRLGGSVRAIAHGEQGIAFLTVLPLWIWRLDRGLVLRAKDHLELPAELNESGWDLALGHRFVDPGGLCAIGMVGPESQVRLYREEKEVGAVPLPAEARLALCGDHLVVAGGEPGGRLCRVHAIGNELWTMGKELAQIDGPGWGEVRARSFGPILAMWDDEGRYLLANLRQGVVRLEGRFCG
jgi:hypothetical protein